MLSTNHALDRAEKALKKGHFRRSEELCNDILMRFPKNKRAQELRNRLPMKNKMVENLTTESKITSRNGASDINASNKHIELYREKLSEPESDKVWSEIESLERLNQMDEKNGEILNRLGEAYMALGWVDKGSKLFLESFKASPNKRACLNLAAYLFAMFEKTAETAFIVSSLRILLQYFELDPSDKEILSDISHILYSIELSTGENESVKKAILAILKAEDICRPIRMAVAVITLLKADCEFRPLLLPEFSINNSNELASCLEILEGIPLLKEFINKSHLPDADIELFLIKLRKALFFNTLKDLELNLQEDWLISLARYAHITEYVLFVSEEEENALLELEEHLILETKNGRSVRLIDVLKLATYRSLGSYSWVHETLFSDSIFQELYSSQIAEPRLEEDLIATIPTLGAISDSTSQAVRDQYEENPYPRWTKTRAISGQQRDLNRLSRVWGLELNQPLPVPGQNPKVLVAGCGTGQHAIDVSFNVKDARVTAIDISQRSLAYAKRKTIEYGIKNIDYFHCDIMSLSEWREKFDLVESIGVLHHMKDPLAGWSSLVDLLKDGGLMKIGLYSESARSHIARIREKTVDVRERLDDRKLRNYRHEMLRSEDPDIVKARKSRDFYTMSTCRDLLFHVEEHRFDLNQLEEHLKNLGLHFCGMDFPLMHKFRSVFPEQSALTDLRKWAEFEEMHPSDFGGMFNFWCQKTR